MIPKCPPNRHTNRPFKYCPGLPATMAGSASQGLLGLRPRRAVSLPRVYAVSLGRSREGDHRPLCQARRQVGWRKWLESGEKD